MDITLYTFRAPGNNPRLTAVNHHYPRRPSLNDNQPIHVLVRGCMPDHPGVPSPPTRRRSRMDTEIGVWETEISEPLMWTLSHTNTTNETTKKVKLRRQGEVGKKMRSVPSRILLSHNMDPSRFCKPNLLTITNESPSPCPQQIKVRDPSFPEMESRDGDRPRTPDLSHQQLLRKVRA